MAFKNIANPLKFQEEVKRKNITFGLMDEKEFTKSLTFRIWKDNVLGVYIANEGQETNEFADLRPQDAKKLYTFLRGIYGSIEERKQHE